MLLLLLAIAGPAFAQEAPPAPRQIEEIVVTAQKKAESAQEVPISLTTISADLFVDAGIDNVHDIAKFTPNVNFATNPCCPTIYIRGFGTSFNASSFDPTVGIALDELSISQSIYFADPFYDVERIEVLRGPQGTLFGKNTTGGLFNVTTGSPTKEFTGSLLGRVGGLGVHRWEAALGGPLGPLGEWAQFRLAVLASQEAGDVENTLLGTKQPRAEQHAARLKLALQPTDDLEVLFIASRMQLDARAFQFQQHELRDSSVDFLRERDPDFEDDGLNHKNSVNRLTLHERDTDLVQGSFRYDVGDLGPLRGGELVAVVGYTGFDASAPIDFDFSPADVAYFLTPAPILYDQYSAEIRFGATTPAPYGWGELELLTGAIVSDVSFVSDVPVVAGEDFEDFALSAPGYELVTGQPAPGGAGFEDLQAFADAIGVTLPPGGIGPFEGDGIRVFSDQSTKSAGGFGQIGWRPTEQWTVSAGGRFTYEEREAHVFGDCFDPGVVCGALGARDFDLDLSRQEDDFSPRFTGQYSPWPELTLFAARSQGFKSGGYNNFSVTGNNLEVEAEKVVSWETGAKGTLFEDTVSYAAAFFNTDAEDLQVQNFVGTSIEVRNAASARSRGVEFDFRWLTPFEPLSFFGAGAYTDARFEDYPNAQAPRSSPSNFQDLSGDRMPFVSEWQFNVTPTLRFPFDVRPFAGGWLPPRWAVTTALDVFWRSDAYLDIDADPNTLQDAYGLLDGRVTLSTLEDKLSIKVSVDNITDTEAFEFITDSTFYPGGYMGFQEFQRNYAVEVRYAW